MSKSDRSPVYELRRNGYLLRQLLLICGVFFLSGTTPRTAQGKEAGKHKEADAAPTAFTYLDAAAAIGDTLYSIDVENIATPPADVQLGVEFALDHFWVTGRSSVNNIKRLYKLNRNGTLDTSFFQWTTSSLGWRDLAFDGRYLYASDENEFAKIDPNTGQKVGTLPKPTGITLLRGLAFDPVRRHFWTTNFSGPLVEFDSTGTIIHSFATPDSAVYGLAWDQWTSGGPYLWMWAQKGPRNGPLCSAIQVNPLTGKATGVRFSGLDFQADTLNDLAGGATISHQIDPSRVVFVGLHQSVPNRVVLYDITSLSPAPPMLASPTNGATGLPIRPSLSWNGVNGASKYHVQIATDTLFISVIATDSLLTGMSYYAAPLQYHFPYFWRVRGGNIAGYGAFSAVWRFTTTLESPNLLSPPNGALNVAATLPLSWNVVPGGASYRLQVATDSLFQQISLDDSLITGTSYQVGPLADTVEYFWRVKAHSPEGSGDWSVIWRFRTGTSTGVSPEQEMPVRFSLEQNYPNPFNPSTTIRYTVPHEGDVRIEIFNVLGERVAVLANERQTAGFHSVVFGSVSMSSGVYYCRMIASDFSEVRTLVLLK